uniref:Uncharacterized protein n=1 Tax=viral metagenome TaxID=1070528 RepID=A0A6M3IJC2_9ZZZZ
MKQLKRIICVAFCALILSASSVIASPHRIWYATSRTGGGVGALDGVVSGVSMSQYDGAIVITEGGEVYVYDVKLDSASEVDPKVIAPDDVGAGTSRWHLAWMSSGVSTAQTIVGGVSIYNCTSGTTLGSEMLGGSFVGNYGAASEVTFYVPAAFKGASVNISLDQDQTSGSTIWVVFLSSSDKVINKAAFKAGNASGTSAFYLSGTTGESITLVGKATNRWRVYEEGTIDQLSR